MKILPIGHLNKNLINKNNSKRKQDNSKQTLSRNSNFLNNKISFAGLIDKQKIKINKIENELSKQNPIINGIGFYGPKSKAKEETFEKFINDLADNEYKIVRIPTINETTSEELAKTISNSIEKAQSDFKTTGKRTLIVVRDLDIIGKKRNAITQYANIFDELLKTENCKEKGFAWVWDAQDVKNIDKTLLRRTSEFILVKPGIEDDKKTWAKYIDIVNSRQSGDEKEYLLNDIVQTIPDRFPINISPFVQTAIEQLKQQTKQNDENLAFELPKLSSFEQELTFDIDELKNLQNDKFNFEQLEKIKIGNKSLVDFWLEADNKNPDNFTTRLKRLYLIETLKDEDKTVQLINLSLDELEKTNALVKSARKNYREILDNETELNDEQKEILIQQQDSKLFFLVISNNLNPDNDIELQLNTIKTIKQLSKEKEEVRQNAFDNIFSKLADSSVLKSDKTEDIEALNYVFGLVNQKIQTSSKEEKENFALLFDEFNKIKENGNIGDFSFIWEEILDFAQEYFENEVLDEFTNNNILLLNSINENKKGIEDKSIFNLLENSNLTIEQKDFIARYASNKAFRTMIKNPDLDIESFVEELVFFEVGNRKLINESGIDFSKEEFEKIMTDKFRQIDRQNRDINIQGDRITAKLDETNAIINRFSNNFNDYAEMSLNLQSHEIQQLIELNNNVKEISQYNNALLRTKLVELKKDKYFSDIVDEIIEILPENSKSGLDDFLSKVDYLAKYEKNSLRKKKILKIASILTAAVSTGAAVYYFGPKMMAHLASKLPVKQIATISANAIAATNTTRLLGRGVLSNPLYFGDSVGKVELYYKAKNVLRAEIASGNYSAKKAWDEIKNLPNNNITSDEIKKILKKYNVERIVQEK